jgi:hypothetical protein
MRGIEPILILTGKLLRDFANPAAGCLWVWKRARENRSELPVNEA